MLARARSSRYNACGCVPLARPSSSTPFGPSLSRSGIPRTAAVQIACARKCPVASSTISRWSGSLVCVACSIANLTGAHFRRLQANRGAEYLVAARPLIAPIAVTKVTKIIRKPENWQTDMAVRPVSQHHHGAPQKTSGKPGQCAGGQKATGVQRALLRESVTRWTLRGSRGSLSESCLCGLLCSTRSRWATFWEAAYREAAPASRRRTAARTTSVIHRFGCASPFPRDERTRRERSRTA